MWVNQTGRKGGRDGESHVEIWKKVVPGKGKILVCSRNSKEPMWLEGVGKKERKEIGEGERRELGKPRGSSEAILRTLAFLLMINS